MYSIHLTHSLFCMNNMNPKVDDYLSQGCGRCPLFDTPKCKVHLWEKELMVLRSFLLDCGLTEEVKWSVPCYTFQQKNIAVMSALNEFCTISFFKGALLNDGHGLLEKPGENTQAARLIKFTSVQKIIALEDTIKAYIYEAIEVERTGLKVEFKKTQEPLPEELQIKFDTDPAFKDAFEVLTPGRQRGYILHFMQAKQSRTRETRIEKCMPKIFAGKGMNE